MFTTAMNFALGEEIEALREMTYRFSQDKIAPIAEETDRSNDFPAHLWKEFGDLGLLGITADPEYGGSGMGNLGQVQADGPPCDGQPVSMSVTLPPLSVVILTAVSQVSGG
jgi:isovaleryl-CoA dehydrogenase